MQESSMHECMRASNGQKPQANNEAASYYAA